MKVAILHYVAGKSSKILAEALRNNGVQCDVFRAGDRNRFKDYDFVFSYGCSRGTEHNNRINKASSVERCVDKTLTFDALKKAGVSTVSYCLKQPVPKEWDWVVIRDKINGRMAQGLNYCENIPGKIPLGQLYTEYFEHKYEYRIMVFMGRVVGRYFKHEEKGDWYFNVQPRQGFEVMDDHCIRAAKSLDIDYVGFDVVANTKKDFRILEANSAARITDEAENAIVEYFINL